MGRADLIKAEESLKDFLLNEYRQENERARVRGRINDIVDTTKYRRLSICFSEYGDTLLILVQIGTYSAVFNVKKNKKIGGSMSIEDIQLIETWISIKSNKEILKNLSKKRSYHEKYVELKPFDDI